MSDCRCRYNKEEEDFETKLLYDDYLEEREDIIFNLVEGIDVKATEDRVKRYQRDNAENIAKNEARKMQRILVDVSVEKDKGNAGAEEERGDQIRVVLVDEGVVLLPSEQEVGDVLRKQTKREWEAMALASGWSPEMHKEQCLSLAFSSLAVD